MELSDLYDIFDKLQNAQETQLNQLKADLLETIAATKTEQKQDIAKICRNQDVLNRQLNELSTSKNASDSPELTKALNTIHLNLNRQEELTNTLMVRFWCFVGLVVILFGIVEWQIYQLPEQTAEQLYQTYYANQPQTKPNSRKR